MTAYIQRHNELHDPPFNGKPEQVEAVQWTGDNLAELKTTLPEVNARIDERSGALIVTSDSSGDGWVEDGWYVGRTAKGWTFVMFPRHFEDRYEQHAAEETT